MLSLLAARAAPGAPGTAIAAASCAAWRGWSGRLFSSTPAAAAAAAAEPPPAAGGATAPGGSSSSEDERAATLPVEQLAKALLAGNARGQLTTVKAGSPAHDQSKVSSSVVPHLCPKGAWLLPIGMDVGLHSWMAFQLVSCRISRCSRPESTLS